MGHYPYLKFGFVFFMVISEAEAIKGTLTLCRIRDQRGRICR